MHPFSLHCEVCRDCLLCIVCREMVDLLAGITCILTTHPRNTENTVKEKVHIVHQLIQNKGNAGGNKTTTSQRFGDPASDPLHRHPCTCYK